MRTHFLLGALGDCIFCSPIQPALLPGKFHCKRLEIKISFQFAPEREIINKWIQLVPHFNFPMWSSTSDLDLDLTSCGPGLVTLDLVRTISALYQWKNLTEFQNLKILCKELSHRWRQLMMLGWSVGWNCLRHCQRLLSSPEIKDTSKATGGGRPKILRW